jgi:hypothetical protein
MPSPRLIARSFGAGRAGLGLVLLVAPDAVTERWLGAAGQTDAARVLARGLGARDIVLGAGAIAGSAESARPWVLAAVVADLADAFASGVASGIPRGGRIGTVALAAGSALLGAWLLRSLD